MATLYINYWGTVDKGVAGDPIKSEAVTTSAASAQSGVIPAGAVVATLSSSALHCVAVGNDPVAAVGAGSFILPANGEREIRLTRHGLAAHKIAAIAL